MDVHDLLEQLHQSGDRENAGYCTPRTQRIGLKNDRKIMHYIDKFRQGFQKYTPMETISFQRITDFATWLTDEGIPLFKSAYPQETGRPVPSLPAGKLIEQAYPKGLNEIDKKHEQQAFYSANAQIFIDTCSRIALTVTKAHSDPKAEPFASRHYQLLRGLVLDALVLLEEWATLTQNVTELYGIIKNNLHDPLQISHAVEQLMYAGSPFFAFTDNATDAGTALLRVALETRLRFGFGLLGKKEIATGAISPLNLSTVLNAVSAHENNLKLAVPLQHIMRLYGWSNIYVHVGLKHFIWSPIFASQYITPFLRGCKGTGNVNSGICIRKEILEAVQNDVEAAHSLDLDTTRYELVKIKPEKCSVVILE